jgi:hypothetical protein
VRKTFRIAAIALLLAAWGSTRFWRMGLSRFPFVIQTLAL